MSEQPPESDRTDGVEDSQRASSDDVASLVVHRIRHQPFLFVIGIVALLGGLIVAASGLQSRDLRFVVGVVAVLVFVAILGYYVLEGFRLHARFKAEAAAGSKPVGAAERNAVIGRVKIGESADEADVKGVRGKGEAPAQRVEGHVEVSRASGRSKVTGVEWEGQDKQDPDD